VTDEYAESAIPKQYLAILYAAMGDALFLSSSVYYGRLHRKAGIASLD